jgi:hypothetical protein
MTGMRYPMRKPPCPKCGLPLASYCSPEPRCWRVDGEKCLDRQLSAANARIAVLERECADLRARPTAQVIRRRTRPAMIIEEVSDE